jgi:molecular chaperone GrpE
MANDERMARSDSPSGPSANSPTQEGETSPETARLASELEKELNDAQSRAQTYLDLAQRTQADFVNYKRRIEQERGEYARSARADIILKVLPIIDDFERAVENRPANLARNEWVQGLELIGRKFNSLLESLGVKPIEATGKPFDPWTEEAILHESSATQPAETVTRVVRNGYTLDGKVIRPAQVIVSSGPPAQGAGQASEADA